MLFMACGSKTGKAVNDTDSLAVDSINGSVVDKHSEAYIRQRIDTIYKYVGKPVYDAEGNMVDYIHSHFNRDSAYCSERYYALMQQALDICDETGDVLYDYDHWVCGQDFSDDWNCKVMKVYHVTDSTAFVDLAIHNFGDSETTIALRFERNDWYIDDFSPSDDGEDDKAYLRRTIKDGKDADAVDAPITQIASAEKAYIAPGDVSKVIVEGCPDGRNMWTYIIDPYKGTAKQLPSTEGVVTLEWEKKEIIAASYGYDDDGRYSVNKAYSLEGKFLRTVGNKERE